MTVVAGLSPTVRIPGATYRLQFNRGFTFEDAQRLVPYFHDLGITDCYASPYLKARPESTHGYDISDHNALNPVIGTEDQYRAFIGALHQHGMGQLLDIVPNHMGIGAGANVWWLDVLENGPISVYAPYFDVDWRPIKRELTGKVLLPILGDQYGRVLENGELRLDFRDGAFCLCYYEHTLPITPRTYGMILLGPTRRLAQRWDGDDEWLVELQSILTAISHLPTRDETEPSAVIERNREKEVVKRRLAVLTREAPEVAEEIAEEIARLNGSPGDARSFDDLDAILQDQAYRLAYWQVAAEEINYRRFFDVNDLAAIRMENPKVFRETHRLIFRLIREGAVTGLRIDHPDGLWDPEEYLRRLQAEASRQLAEGSGQEQGPLPAAGCPLPPPLYVVVEKILAKDEPLPEEWPVHGTTGYDFATEVGGLFVDAANRKRFDDLYDRFIGRRIHTDFHDLAYECKRSIMRFSLASEVNVLAAQLSRLAERDRRSRDFTLNALLDAVREVIACFPVYRTYITRRPVAGRDRAYIELAVAWARRRNLAREASVFQFLRDTLLLHVPDGAHEALADEQLRFVMKFQQTTGPVMAKAVEDTAFYIDNRLVSLNEVGGEPGSFGVSPSAFHRVNAERLRRWPGTMLSTSTHDTKRSEDVRARITVLSELPRDWAGAISRWSRLNRRKKRLVDGQLAPSRNDEYLLYQVLLGAWPFGPLAGEEREVFVGRVQQYMAKGTKEAKVRTSWVNPNEGYDDALRDFVRAILDEGGSAAFLEDFLQLQRRVAHFGVFNSLSQTLLKLTVPGVPDIYQGNELWDFSLVDPDNRRPIDYRHRTRLLEQLRSDVEQTTSRKRGASSSSQGEGGESPQRPAFARSLVDTAEDGRIKLYVTWRTLTFRRDHADLFREGEYTPLETAGPLGDHVCAFARRLDGDEVLVTVPRLVTRLVSHPISEGEGSLPLGPRVWGELRLVLPEDGAARYRNLFTGEAVEGEAPVDGGRPTIRLAHIFANFPVALLHREAP